MTEKETSNLSIDRKECSKCGAVWLNGQHRWHTGSIGDNKTLSNLVCGLVDSPECINPEHKVGHIYGESDSWEKRSKFIDSKIQGDNYAPRTDDTL